MPKKVISKTIVIKQNTGEKPEKKESTDKKITRLLYLLNRLDKGEVSLNQAAKEMGVVLRTVQRYITTLQEADFPVYDVRPGVYSFVEGFSLSKMQITAKEAGVLAFLSDVANAMGSKFSIAYKGLCRRITASGQESPFFLKIVKGLNYEDSPLTQTLSQAIRKKHYLLVNYKSQTSQVEKKHLVIPIKIAWYEGFWYLICLGNKDKLFKFRLDRIIKAQIQKNKFKLDDEKFNELLKQSVNIFFEGQRNIEVCLKISSSVAHYFKQRSYFPEQKIIKEEKSGDIIISTKISKAEEILMIIFHWIPYIKVISPQEIKDKVKTTIENYLKQI